MFVREGDRETQKMASVDISVGAKQHFSSIGRHHLHHEICSSLANTRIDAAGHALRRAH